MPFIALIAVIGILLLQPTGAIPLSSGRWGDDDRACSRPVWITARPAVLIPRRECRYGQAG
jgi:hypothetical protein